MMKIILPILVMLMLSSCAHNKVCGNPEGAKVVYFEENGCRVRIRQVTIGSDLKIPASLKGETLSAFDLEWVEPTLTEGKIVLGYFQLRPKAKDSK